MACVGTPDEFRANPGAEKSAFCKDVFDVTGADNVDYYGSPTYLAGQNFKNGGWESYVISPVDNLDKFSRSFKNCTGIVVVGYDKRTGENISFLSHEDPAYFLDKYTNQNNFVSDLRQRLLELKERCAEGTIDAAIVGGNYFKDRDIDNSPRYREHYRDSIELLSDETEKILGFKPVVITGPKRIKGRDHIFYENKHRRLYISRPEVGDATTESFDPSAIKDQEKKW
jgi:hypothetical protein